MSLPTQRLSILCEMYSIDILYSYGSRATEVKEFVQGDRDSLSLQSGHGQSDIDIGARAVSGVYISTKEKVHLTDGLEELFAGTRVDLAFFHEVDPFVAANIVRGERLYCRNIVGADEFELFVLRRAGDLAPLERERMRLIEGEG